MAGAVKQFKIAKNANVVINYGDVGRRSSSYIQLYVNHLAKSRAKIIRQRIELLLRGL